MSKAPAFQFYAADFLVGTAAMSAEEVGAYIRLLAYQWEQGGLSSDERALRGLAGARRISAAVLSKFPKSDDGLLRNARLEIERAKQAAFRETRAENARKRWEKEQSTSNARASKVHNGSTCKTDALRLQSSSSDNIAEREQGAGSGEQPDWKTVQAFAASIGLAEWKALDWFNEMEGCGWIDHQSRPIRKWQPVLTRVKAKWEADGRPSGPPAARVGQNHKPQQPTKTSKFSW